jgi:glycosyltransferase involved in cell wall biosynthesis
MNKILQKKPTIVQVAPCYPPHLGGTENAVEQIAEGFVEKGYTVLVYTSDIGYSQSKVSNSKAQVHYLKSIEFAHTPIIFPLFFRLLTIPRHALIHLHVAQAFSPEVVYLISKLKGIPYIAHIHYNANPTGPWGMLLKPYKQWFLKRVLKSAAQVICLSEQQKELVASEYALPLECLVVIPNGVDEKYFITKNPGENAIPHLLFVGRLVSVKNLPLLIEAVSQMKTSVVFDIVGEGEEREKLEELLHRYGLQNVKLHGKKTGKELVEFYRSADIFVLPSLQEAFSLAMLEALAAGLPVVASDLPEMRQAIGDCGVLVQDPTAANYAKALDEIISNKNKMEEISALSIQKARSYSWTRVLNSIEEVYEKITSSHLDQI